MKNSKILAVLLIVCILFNSIVPFNIIYAVNDVKTKKVTNDLEKIEGRELSKEQLDNLQCKKIGSDFYSTKLYAFSRNNYSSTYGYNTLDSQSKKNVYKKIQYVAYEFNNSSEDVNSANGMYPIVQMDIFNENLTPDEVLKVYYTFLYDNPIYYWLDNSLYYYYIPATGKVTEIVLGVKSEYAQGQGRCELTNTIETNIERYLDFVSPMSNDFEKELILHEALIYDNDYAYNSNGQPEDSAFAHNIVGIFDNDPKTGPVCEGYAKAFVLLMSASGIDCGLVAGEAGGGGHAWNQVKLDNEWYNVDVTWDDPGGQTAYYDFFNVVDSEFRKTHTPFPSSNTFGIWCYDTFECTATKYSIENQQDNIPNFSLAKTVTYDSTEQLPVCIFNQGVEVPSGIKVLPNTKLDISILSKDIDIEQYYMLDVNGTRLPIKKVSEANGNGYIEYMANYTSISTDMKFTIVEKSDDDFDLVINKQSITFNAKGNTQNLEATFKGKNVDINKLKFVTNNSYVAKVNNSGIITSAGCGTATVKVIYEELNKEAVCNIIGQMQYLLGDVDNSGEVEISDAYALLRFIVARMDESTTPSAMLPAANVSDDDEIDIMDAYSLLRLVVKNM